MACTSSQCCLPSLGPALHVGNLPPVLLVGPEHELHAGHEGHDGLAYEFVLRKGVRFHNGDPVTADDVKFS